MQKIIVDSKKTARKNEKQEGCNQHAHITPHNQTYRREDFF